MKIKESNKIQTGSFGLLYRAVFYGVILPGMLYLFLGIGSSVLQADDAGAGAFGCMLALEEAGSQLDISQSGLGSFFHEYQRAIWIIGGLLVIIGLLLVNMVRHRRIERRLVESESRWKLLFKSLPGGSFIVNEQHEIEDVNDALCEMTGFSREELIGKSCKTLCTNPTEPCLHSACGMRRVSEQEGTIKAQAGSDISVLKSVQRIALEGRTVILENLQDMTRHKKLEASLQRSEEVERIFRKRLASLHEMNMILTHAESRDDLIKMAVELARDRLELKRIEIWLTSGKCDEIVGSFATNENGHIRDYRQRRHVIGEGHFMRKALDANRPGFFTEIVDVFEAGKNEDSFGPRVSSTLWDGHSVTGFIVADTRHASHSTSEIQDKILNIFAFTLGHMHSRLTMGQERRDLEAQLQQSAKMEAVGRLAGGVAHDFNNQLTVITGYCDLLMRELAPGSMTYESIEQIEKSARQASVLTGELLNLSRKETLESDVIQPGGMIRGMEKSLSMLGEDVKLKIHTEEDLGNVRVDVTRFQQVIMNLAINARDAMPDGGRLLIKAVNYVHQGQTNSMIAKLKPGNYVRISIADTGVGMDEETRQKVFEPFFTTKSKGKGTGLGLAQVYGFVQQSGGEITLESEKGRGTTFSIYLPRSEEAVSQTSGCRDKSPVHKSSETVLIVEDDPAVRRLVVRVLREYGYDVMETGHPEDALRMVQLADKPIDLLISDVVMPGLSGPKLADALEDIQPGLKVLYISGYTEETVLKHGVRDIGIAFLHKPFSPEDLHKAIHQTLRASAPEAVAAV